MLRLLIVVLACAPLGACVKSWGLMPERYGPAVSPRGAPVQVHVSGERAPYAGELFAADSAGLVLKSGQMVLIPWRRVRRIKVDQLGLWYDPDRGVAMDSVKMARLGALSRFPQGLRGDLLQRVLTSLNQPALVSVP